LAALAGASPGKSADGKCSGALPSAPAGFPAALVVTTNCGRFTLEPGKSVVYAGPWTSPVPPVARGYWPDDLTWYGRLGDGHLVLGRGMQELWRSHGTYAGPRQGDVDVVALGRAELAFSFSLYRGRRSRLYIARYGEPERLVAHGEMPLAFTPSDELVTWRERGGALTLRDENGRVQRRLAARAVDPKVDRASGVVVFRSKGRLFAFGGARVRKLASLRKLNLVHLPIVEPLGGLVAVYDRRRLVVLDYDGRIVASTALPAHPKRADGISSPVVANAAGTAVAFTATNGNTAYGSSGRETVYLLTAGERRARPVFAERVMFEICERGASLSWDGGWLLYANSEQQAAVIDSSGNAPTTELGNVIAQLPGYNTDEDRIFDIAWA
jgi:hypothetical protein